MKRIAISIILAICLLSSFGFSIVAGAAEENSLVECSALMEVSKDTQYFEDGSYLVTTIKASPSSRASIYTRTGTKEVILYNSSDEVQWNYYLIGTFTVETGVSAVCTNSTYSYTIVNDKWSLKSHNNYYSGNIAYGEATFKKKVLLITTNTYDIEIYVACDANGVIS